MRLNKQSKNNNDPVKKVLLGTMASLLLIIVGTSIGAWLILEKGLDENVTKYTAIVVLIVSTYIGNLVGANNVFIKRWKTILMISSIILVVLIGINCVMFDTKMNHIMSTFLSIAFGGVLACCLYPRRKARIKKYRTS